MVVENYFQQIFTFCDLDHILRVKSAVKKKGVVKNNIAP